LRYFWPAQKELQKIAKTGAARAVEAMISYELTCFFTLGKKSDGRSKKASLRGVFDQYPRLHGALGIALKPV
jgi:hypothetical protein